MRAPERFDVATAAQDFGYPGRVVKPYTDRKELLTRHGMKVYVAGWVFSAIWGFGAYCSNFDFKVNGDNHPGPVSPDAEVALWRKDGSRMSPLTEDGDSVLGHVSPAAFLKGVEAAEGGKDADGIGRAMLEQMVKDRE
jgi:hypothetical protein